MSGIVDEIETKTMFPQSLIDAVTFLNQKVNICEESEDGRVNSIKDEDTVIDLLISSGQFNIVKPQARHWWDVCIDGYFVNVKSSGFKSADNFSSKEAILYTLTDIPVEEITNYKSWNKFENALIERSVDTQRNYYIIVVNKKTGEVTLQSLKTLNKLTSNGNNLPFQIAWKDNMKVVERNYQESRKFILDSYVESVEKKINQHKCYHLIQNN